MKLNIAYPQTGAQICVDIDDEKKLRTLYDKRMSQEVDGEGLGEEYKGYVFRITGGNDKQGFPMKQGVLSQTRARLLLVKGQSCYRERRSGMKKRKGVRGCIVGPDIRICNLVVTQEGEKPIPGLTDIQVPRRLGPKRASKIRKLFNLTKADDVRKYVVGRETKTKQGHTKVKRPRIQRLITPVSLQRKRRLKKAKIQACAKSKNEEQEYKQMIAQYNKEKKKARQSSLAKRRSRLSKMRASKAE